MQQIHVGVASPSVFDSQIDQIRYGGGRFKLKGFQFVKITGEDRESFLHNFLTSNIKALPKNNFQISTRLNIRGQLQFFLFVLKRSKDFLIMIPKNRKNKLLEELKKYIIAEDVEYLEEKDLNAYVYFDPSNKLKENSYQGTFLGETVKLIVQDEPTAGFEKIQPYALKTLSYLTGWPIGDENFEEVLINNLYLNEIAVDYDKGCFLGQETAAKINNNRGGATFPALISIGENPCEALPGDAIFTNVKELGKVISVFIEKEETFILAATKREYLIDQNKIQITLNEKSFDSIVYLYPYFKDQKNSEKSKTLLEGGLEFFQEDLHEDAMLLIKQAIAIDPTNADAYESLGVILGRDGRFEEAISYMDKLSEVDPLSVMAHTNKSLYLMKLGKIEEAEEEKGIATVKTFERLGREAKEKKEKEEEDTKLRDELLSREKMFQEVLELDEVDEFANIQLAAIKLKLGKSEYIKDKFEFLESNFSNNPEMYLVLSKYLKETNQLNDKFKSLVDYGIELAAKKGNKKLVSEFNQLR